VLQSQPPVFSTFKQHYAPKCNTAQERIAAKMRQKLPHSPNDSAQETSAPPMSDGPRSGVSANSQLHQVLASSSSSSSRISSSIDNRATSPLVRTVNPEGGRVLSATDHELSTAVFGKSNIGISSSSSNNSISGMNSDAARTLPPSITSSAQVVSSSEVGRVSGIDSGSSLRESVAGSVPVSLLEFRRLVAGGLPNPATRYFVVTGRGLAGAMRVTQITPDGVYGTYVRKDDRQGAGVDKGSQRLVGPVRISELKEIVSYRGGAAPQRVTSENDMHRGGAAPASSGPVLYQESDMRGDAVETVAATSPSSPAPAVDRQQLRAAVSNLSLFTENVDDNISASSSPAYSSSHGTATASHTARVAAATRQLIQVLTLEDGSRCLAVFYVQLSVAILMPLF
jgi:hypothetical protein